MLTENNSLNQKKEIETIDRTFIENEIDRILRKSQIKIEKEKKKQYIDFLIQNLPFFTATINKKRDFSQIETLISKSQKDLELSKAAYKLKDYSNTLFHLQQTIEKATKVYGLFLGIIENPQEIRHTTPKVFLKLLRLSWVDDLSKIYSYNYNIKKDLTNLEVLVKDKENILDLDNNIPLFINLYENILRNSKKALSKREVKKLIHYVKINYGMDIKERYMAEIKFALFLYLFSFITFIYAVEPRYSNEIEYSKLNIIKYFNKIVKLLEV